MKFTELQDELKEKFGATKLADIAREFDVTPQVVSNWKSRNYVPYKYVQSLGKIQKTKNPYIINPENVSLKDTVLANKTNADYEYDEKEFVKILFSFFEKINKNRLIAIISPIVVIFSNLIILQFYTQDVYMSTAKIMPVSEEGGVLNFQPGIKKFGVSLGGTKS